MKSPIMAIREKERLSRTELIKKCGIPRSSLWFIEHGQKENINHCLLVYLYEQGYDVGQVVKDYDDYMKSIGVELYGVE